MPKDMLGITTYTVEETAEILGITKRTLQGYLKAGKMAASKIGGQWAITEQQIKDYINNRSVVDNGPWGKSK